MDGELIMFIVSIKGSKLKEIAIIALVAVFAVIGGIISVSSEKSKPVSAIGGVSLKAATSEERVAFFSQFGWQVNETPVEIKEVVIPEEFDETYSEYNEIQKSQSLNLEKYKGVRVKHFTYEILNYPGYNSDSGLIHGNILVYDNTVIGGDVCSIELNGFMHTFTLPRDESVK